MASNSMKVDGLVSGINTTDLINSIMESAKAPVKNLETKRTKLETRKSALQDVNSLLLAFQAKTSTLSLTSTFKVKKISSSDEKIATATANADAVKGTYKLNVTKLATSSQSLSSTSINLPAASAATVTSITSINSVVGQTVNPNGKFNATGLPGNPTANLDSGQKVIAGSFKINGVQINVAADDTINTVMNKINDSSAGVTAKIENNRFVLTQKTKGASSTITANGDTTGFFAAVKLSGASITAGVDAGENRKLSELTSLGFTNGYFQINNTTFSVDTASESLSDIMKKVNKSSAGVTMSYDSQSGKIIISNTDTGNKDLKLGSSTDTSNFLEKVKLEAGSASVGSLKKVVSGANAVDAQLSTKLTDLKRNGTSLNLASGQKYQLKITGADGTGTNTVEIDNTLGDKTFNDVINAINGAEGTTKVHASLDTSITGNVSIKLARTDGNTTNAGISITDVAGHTALTGAGSLFDNTADVGATLASSGDLETSFKGATGNTYIKNLFSSGQGLGMDTKFQLNINGYQTALIDNTNGDKTINDFLGAINSISGSTNVKATLDTSDPTNAKIKLARTDGTGAITISDQLGNFFSKVGLASGNDSMVNTNGLQDFATSNVPDADENTLLTNLASGANQLSGLTGSFTFGLTKNDGTTLNVNFDNSLGDKSINDFLQAINSNVDSTGIMATLDNDSAGDVKIKLNHYTKNSDGNYVEDGKAVGISDVSGDLVKNLGINTLGNFTQGIDAQLKINDIDTTRPGNTFQMNGVTFNLKATGDATISIDNDYDAVIKSVDEYVTAYNDTMTKLKTKYSEDPVKEVTGIELTDDEKKQGVLKWDSLLRDTMTKLRSIVNSPVSGLPSNMNNLAAVGISTGAVGSSVDAAKNGTLELDKDKLRKALEKDIDSVMNIFRNNKVDVSSEDIVANKNSSNVVNGVNSTFYLANKDVDKNSYFAVTVNGITYRKVTGTPSKDPTKNEYSLDVTNGKITFGVAPAAGSTIKSSYSYSVSDGDKAGVITRQKNYLIQMTKVKGTIASYTADTSGSIDKQIADIDKEINNYNDRLAIQEQSLWSRYTAMETALSKMKSQSSAFASMLSSSS